MMTEIRIDWTPFRAGDMAPEPGTLVTVEYRDGLKSKAIRAGKLRWAHEGRNDDIVAYHAYDEEQLQ